MSAKIVTIDLGLRSYDIYIGSGLLYRIADFVPMELDGRKVFIITDVNCETYATRIKDILSDAGSESVEVLTLPSGEATKSFKSLEQITQWLLDKGIGRDSLMVAVGGGVIGDITGFCASITLRGVPYIQIPTTLLAQVDSSVGGKTGINTKQGKNLIGSFYQPVAVIADIETLKTLPRRELLAGYAEIVKYGLINDLTFFNWLDRYGKDVCNLDEDSIIKAIETSVKAKAGVVQADEREQGGQRALLNFGHTFGHALEAAAGYDGRLLHGEAVAIGIIMALTLSVRMNICPREDLERVEAHFANVGLPTQPSFVQPPLKTSAEKLYEIMGHDKKVSKGNLNLILANGIGEAYIEDSAPEKQILKVLQDSLVDTQGGEKDGGSIAKSFANKGVKGLWKSAFSSRS